MKLAGKRSILSGVLAAVFLFGGVTVRAEAYASVVTSVVTGDVNDERVRPAGEVVVVLTEDFMNALLDAILSQPSAVKFPLSKGGSGRCASEIVLAKESGGRRTAVRFAEGRISALVAFRGNYEAALLGCLNFEGWADSTFNLSFDRERQAFVARVEVREVSLRNIPSMMSTGITGLVQDAIDQRVNPVVILRADQLAARLPIAQGEPLTLRAREIRHEIVGKELRLRIVYEIVGGQ